MGLPARLRACDGNDGLTIIAVTGYGHDHDRKLAREAGFDAHLMKLVDFDSLQTFLNVNPRKRLQHPGLTNAGSGRFLDGDG